MIYHDDCMKLMQNIPDKSIDCIICDLPYNIKARRTTWNDWDCEINITELFKEYKRIRKDNAPIILFASDLFSARLISENWQEYKYKWIWKKEAGTGFLNAKRMPLRDFEEILVFYKKQPTYNPQMREGKAYTCKKGSLSSNYCKTDKIVITENTGERYPLSILEFKRDKGLHPTQKPLALMEYLVKTYTNEGNIILDNCMGSGTTGLACKNLNRNFIGVEIKKEYFDIAKKRIENK